MPTYIRNPNRRNRWQDWANVVLAIWLFISPWVLRFATSNNATASNVIAGALVVIFAWIGLAMRRRLTTAA